MKYSDSLCYCVHVINPDYSWSSSVINIDDFDGSGGGFQKDMTFFCLCVFVCVSVNVQGAVLINENAAKLVERYMNFREGLAYGIDQLLEPPGLGAYCDTLENRTTYVSAANTALIMPLL